MSSVRPSRLLVADLALVKAVLERLIVPTLMVLVTFLFGTVGFFLIGGGRWSALDCAYMTSITLTTVGYGEVLDEIGSRGRLFSMVLMWSGMGVTLYAVSTITAFLVETDLWKIIREQRMERRIAALRGHIIVCGAGKTGFNVIREIHTTKHACVVIDGDRDRLQWMQEHFKDLFCLFGDATEEEVLKRAGIQNASGIIATLSDDSHNLLITVQARYVNPNIKIVTRCNENDLADKFYRAGVNYVVNPAFIGGMRMASEMIRPNVVTFLDRMLRGQDQSVRVEEVVVSESSPWVGASLKGIDIYRHAGLLPIALKQPDQEDFCYNPSPDERLKVGTVIIAIGNTDQIAKLRQFCSPGAAKAPY